MANLARQPTRGDGHRGREPNDPRRRTIRARACTIPNGVNGDAHLAIHHVGSRTLTYSGPASGAGWALACQLARLLGAKARSIPLPAQVDILDRLLLYEETLDANLYEGLPSDQLEIFWAEVAKRRMLAIQAVA